MVIIIMGVTGSGKSTVGEQLAQDLDWPYYDADDFHPDSNVQKMASGTPRRFAARTRCSAALPMHATLPPAAWLLHMSCPGDAPV